MVNGCVSGLYNTVSSNLNRQGKTKLELSRFFLFDSNLVAVVNVVVIVVVVVLSVDLVPLDLHSQTMVSCVSKHSCQSITPKKVYSFLAQL